MPLQVSADSAIVKSFTADQWAVIVQDVKNLRETLDGLRKTNEQQALKISALQSTIDNQALILPQLKINLENLSQTSELNKTMATIGWSVAGVSLLVNTGQAILYQVKK